MSVFDQDAPCAANHDTVPEQFRCCPVCGDDLDRPGRVSGEEGVVVLTFPSVMKVHPHVVDRKPGIGDDMAGVIRTLRCLLIDLRDWVARARRR